MNRKGIILAGGKGSRLFPSTKVVSKQLLPVFDKPMIYYPLATLMLANIRDILIISTPEDTPRFKNLLGNGKQWGLSIKYEVQDQPNGIAEALIIGEQFLDNCPCALILGDNIFYGHALSEKLEEASLKNKGATVFCYRTAEPENYGVISFNEKGKAVEIEEKPTKPKSNFAITGLYFYDPSAVQYAKTLTPSHRDELEITDLNQIYLSLGLLKVEQMGRGFAWLDTGTPGSLIEASQFVRTIESRQGLKICVPEEIAFQKNWIDLKQLETLSAPIINSDYGKYLLQIINDSKNAPN